jgi:catechol 2,3-dioxygenase-like lactoylglutathione lyase family enzyme
MADAQVDSAIAFGGVTPVLRVADVEASRDYYVRVLGFKVNFETPGFISVLRGRCGIFLSQGDQGNPGSWVWIDGKDVEAVFEEYKASGAKIRHPPANYSWALEMQVEDLDGNVLRIGSSSKAGEPIGEWLDMRGVRWRHLTDDKWTRVEEAP